MAELAAQLGETEPEPRGEIRRTGQWLGAETALAILAATEQVGSAGGCSWRIAVGGARPVASFSTWSSSV